MGSRAGLNDVEKRKFLTLRDSNSDPSVVQPVASHYTDYVIKSSVAKKKSLVVIIKGLGAKMN
jgi:hypothetical protein